MSKKKFDIIRKELLHALILFVVIAAMFQIIYYKENFVVTLRFVLSLFWIFIVPGYFAMLYWSEKLDFTERIVIGIALSAAVIGIFSYYIGLMGLNVKYHGYFLPIVIIVAGFLTSYYKKD